MAPSPPSTSIATLDPPALGPGHPLYAHITSVPLSNSTFLTIAGQVPLTPPTEANPRPTPRVPSGLKAQMELCLSRIATCLEASGAKKTDMTRLMYYFTKRAWQEEDALKLVLEVVGKWLGGHRPASVLLVVKGLSQPEFLCEFEAQAVVVR